MRRIIAFTGLALLTLPAMAMAQDASVPPPPGAPGMQPGMQPPPPGQYAPTQPDAPDMPPPPQAAGNANQDRDAAMMDKWRQRFAAANTSNDGHLTIAQAQAAGMYSIAKHFGVIDTQNLGYITFDQLMAWHLDDQAQKLERRAAALRAQD